MIEKITLGILFLWWNIFFQRSAIKENGGQDKKEMGIQLLGNIVILFVYAIISKTEIDASIFNTVFWAFVVSLGIFKAGDVIKNVNIKNK